MRDIKFRVWSKEGNSFLEWEDLLEAPDFAEFMQHGHKEDVYYSKMMQYTGLKDKNGIEIYEGDIVKRIEKTGYTFVGKVVYEEYGFGIKPYGFFTPLSKSGKYDDGKSSFDFSVEYEIIGNIYQNPELLLK